eukprot:TRINITY_DN34793_c0_g3_i1.p2 TRINITY_DN34793_c0_g3~~TRINITY_DN34793_c0_g3_i1.p2  ORF type:complete len:144 (-),score=1.17 TRINITY_DN34793_c0_g3_i1:58-489(-)
MYLLSNSVVSRKLQSNPLNLFSCILRNSSLVNQSFAFWNLSQACYHSQDQQKQLIQNQQSGNLINLIQQHYIKYHENKIKIQSLQCWFQGIRILLFQMFENQQEFCKQFQQVFKFNQQNQEIVVSKNVLEKFLAQYLFQKIKN